jgi:hypothetical protein
LEKAFIARGSACAFDLLGPAGDLPDTSGHALGDPDFVMRNFADGYIVLDRLANLTGCELDPGYVSPATFEDAEGMPMGIEQHLMRLQQIGPH